MSGSPATAERSWIVPLVRAGLLIVPSIVITFSQDHTPGFGLTVFGVWAIVTGLVVGALQLRFGGRRLIRSIDAASAVLTVVAGLLALSLPAALARDTAGELALFLFIVSAWAAVTGFLELYTGIRLRGVDPAARDRLATGAFTAVLAIAFLLLPPNDVVSVGLLGAYFVIAGVFLAIAGFSLKWAGQRPEAAQAADGTDAR